MGPVPWLLFCLDCGPPGPTPPPEVQACSFLASHMTRPQVATTRLRDSRGVRPAQGAAHLSGVVETVHHLHVAPVPTWCRSGDF